MHDDTLALTALELAVRDLRDAASELRMAAVFAEPDAAANDCLVLASAADAEAVAVDVVIQRLAAEEV